MAWPSVVSQQLKTQQIPLSETSTTEFQGTKFLQLSLLTWQTYWMNRNAQKLKACNLSFQSRIVFFCNMYFQKLLNKEFTTK